MSFPPTIMSSLAASSTNAACSSYVATCWGRAPSRWHAAGQTFVDFSIYKGRAALQIKPIPPTWRSSGSARSIEREGVILVEAAAASKQRDYDWGQKQVFALNILEIGKLMTRSEEEVQFVHDPNKGRANEGSTIKTFKLTRMNTDSKSFPLTLNLLHPAAIAAIGYINANCVNAPIGMGACAQRDFSSLSRRAVGNATVSCQSRSTTARW
eukprot:COSAG02_NODE_280_length_25797_cov_66.644447_18_plen_211_part_00